MKAKIENGKYYDKNGIQIHEGDMIKCSDGKVRKIYLTDKDELGTDATNPLWIENGRYCECEYGIYPIEEHELAEIEVVNL